jgi:hypothetical protein
MARTCGAPCPNCNVPADGERPRLPAGFMTDIDADDQDR